MKKIINWIKNNVERLKKYSSALFYVLLAALGGGLTWFTYNYAIQFSDFGLIILFLILCLGFYHLFDAVILKEIDFIDEIRSDGRKQQGNIAYAIVLLAIAVIVLAGAITVS